MELKVLTIGMLVIAMAAIVPPSSGSETNEDSFAIHVHVGQGGVDSIDFIFDPGFELFVEVEIGDPLLDVYNVLIDLYIFSGTDPTVTNLPGKMISILDTPGSSDCVPAHDGNLMCWHSPGTPTTVRQREPGDVTDLIALGEGCIIVSYTNGDPDTVVDDLPLVASGELTPGQSCPA